MIRARLQNQRRERLSPKSPANFWESVSNFWESVFAARRRLANVCITTFTQFHRLVFAAEEH
jgi:hypothetical protein